MAICLKNTIFAPSNNESHPSETIVNPACMKHHGILFLIASLLLLACPALRAVNYSDETNYWLQQLDSEMLQVDEYVRQKQERVDMLNTQRKQIKNEEDRYYQNRLIYDECQTFDSELAMEVVDENIEIASRRHDDEHEIEWQIKRSFVLSSTGLFMEALEPMSSLRSQITSHELLLQYYNQMQYLYSHLWQYTWKNELQHYYQSYNKLYNDSISMIIRPEDGDYLWHQAWHDLDADRAEASVNAVKAHVDSLPRDSRPDAMLNYVLARLYESEGNEDMCVQYLAKSAIADIRSANQDIASLEELAIKMYNVAEVERIGHSLLALDNDLYISRAYNYINICMTTAQRYNNRVRTVSLSSVLDQILQAYLLRDAHQRDRLKMALWTVCILLLLVVLSVVAVWRQNVRLHRSRRELASANGELSQNQQALAEANAQLVAANAQLKEAMSQQAEANQRLREADLVKEEYIGYLFSICSNYISKLDDFRKNINRKAKVKLWDEVLQMTDKSSMVQDELKEFYHNFDAIFLHLYPDFVTQFNELLAPDERIEPRKGELLNTDLRIYALVRLGINDSVKIAEFLHCSPQTVYNNRLKIRSKTILPKEDFLRTVQHLGHPENLTDAES